MDQPDDLTQTIRQKVLAGTLPQQYCRMTWYGPGRGSTCIACDLPIRSTDVEVECDLPSGGTITFHQRCYEIWANEWPSCDG